MTTLGVGLAAVGRPAYLNLGHAEDVPPDPSVREMRARSHAVLDRAWEAGIRHADAARSYGLAEQFLGDWLREHPGRREQLTVGSKWGYAYVGGWRVRADTHEVKDHTLETFERQWAETLEALGSPPDLYLVHSVTPDSPTLSDPALLTALHGLAATGVRVGLSTSGPSQAPVLHRALDLGEPFSAVQATWNLLEPSASDAVARAAAAGWHVALKETVANGRLTSRGDAPAVLELVARAIGTTTDAVAVAAALAQPVDVVLLGPATVAQLDSNLAATRTLLSDEQLASLALLAEPPEEYWSTRSEMPWT